MKKSSPTTSSINVTSKKTLIVNASTKGGVQKTSNSLDLIDMVWASGNNLTIYDGDARNSGGISGYLPTKTIPLSVNDEEDLFSILEHFAASEERLALLDLPGAVIQGVAPFFVDNTPALAALNLQLHLLIHVTSDPSTLQGAAAWISTLRSTAKYSVFSAQREQDFDLQKTDTGRVITEIAEGRVIVIPRMSPALVAVYQAQRRIKSQLSQHSELNALTRIRFANVLRTIWTNLSPHYTEITGLLPPPPEDWPVRITSEVFEDDADSPLFERLHNEALKIAGRINE